VASPATSPSAASSPAASPAAAVSPLASPSAAPAAFDEAAVAAFYQGKTVRLIVGTAAGGGYDTYARVIAKYLGNYIPGKPTVVVENMPGAGSVLATKQVYGGLPKDGTVIGSIIAQNVAADQLFNNPTDYDMTRMTYLGAPGADKFVFFVHQRAGISSLDELIGPNAKPLTIGSVAPAGDPGSLMAAYLNISFGAKIKNVSGYAGTAPLRLAIDQGEVDGFVNAWQSHVVTSKDKTDSGEWRMLAQETLDPIPGVPAGIPTLRDFVKDPELLEIGRLAILPNDFARPYFVAPGVPADRAAALRQAFEKALADPDLRADAAKANLELAPITGDRMLTMITEFLTVPEATKAKLKPILAP
jgi:tripartite-type tricarboxylate transporter receptor subunit TctC